MRKQKSRHNQRQLERVSPGDHASAEVRRIAAKPFVTSVEDHFAGYFNELGLFLTVVETATDAQVLELRNELLQCLETLLPKGKAAFTWLVTIKRGGYTIEVVVPGAVTRELTDVLEPML